MTRLPPLAELMFRQWYKDILKKRNQIGMPLNPDPDDHDEVGNAMEMI